MTTWLVTGGAGYIGSHVVRALLASGRDVVVLDDFSAGLEQRVPAGVPVVRADVHDRAAVAATLRDHDVDGVVHLAAKKAAGESVDIPLYYYRENVDGLLTVLEAMQEAGVREPRLLVVGGRLRHAAGEPGRRGRAAATRSRRTARPRWSASGWPATAASPGACPGPRCATSTWPAPGRTTSATTA